MTVYGECRGGLRNLWVCFCHGQHAMTARDKRQDCYLKAGRRPKKATNVKNDTVRAIITRVRASAIVYCYSMCMLLFVEETLSERRGKASPQSPT